MHRSLAILAASTLLTTQGLAEPLKESGGYIGLAYGVTSLEDDDYFSPLDLDQRGQAWQIYGGYRFFKYLAVEGRYNDFGSYTADFSGIPGEIKAEYSAFTIHALGILPLGQSGFDIYGQLGLGMIFYEAKETITGYGLKEDDDATTWSVGAGARYTPPRFQHLTVQLAYDFYGFEAEDSFYGETYNQGISMGKLGVQYNF